MKLLKAYLKDKNEPTLSNVYFSSLYVAAIRLIKALDDPAVDPVKAYQIMAEKIQAGEVDPRKLFTPRHWESFERIQDGYRSGQPVSVTIESDPRIKNDIISAYRRLTRHLEMSSPQESTPTDEVAGEFDYESMKEVFKAISAILTQYLQTLQEFRQRFTQYVAHVPPSDRIEELKKDVEKAAGYLSHELGVVNNSLSKGAEGVLDMAPPTLAVKAADGNTATFQLLREFHDFTANTKKSIDTLWKRYFFKSGEKGDLAKTVMQQLKKVKPDQKGRRAELWGQFSDYLGEITEKFSKNLPLPKTGKNQPFPSELLDDAHRILKWNMVKVIGDFNIGLEDLARLKDPKLSPLTREAPEAPSSQVEVNKVPFDSFYEKFNDNMGRVYEFLETSLEKLQELTPKAPDGRFNEFATIVDNIKNITSKGFTDMIDIKQSFTKQAQAEPEEDISMVYQQIQQYVDATVANIDQVEKWLNLAITQLQKFHQQNTSDEDLRQADVISAVLQEMITGIREQRVGIDTFKKNVEEAGKSNYQKLEEWWANNKNNVGNKSKQLWDYISQGADTVWENLQK